MLLSTFDQNLTPQIQHYKWVQCLLILYLKRNCNIWEMLVRILVVDISYFHLFSTCCIEVFSTKEHSMKCPL